MAVVCGSRDPDVGADGQSVSAARGTFPFTLPFRVGGLLAIVRDRPVGRLVGIGTLLVAGIPCGCSPATS